MMQVCNVRKLHFQANVYEVLTEDKKQDYCGSLCLGWAFFQETVFNH